MKTAMQELKEWYEETPPQTRFGVMYGKIILLLEKEKQQIIDAYRRGCTETYGVDEPNPNDPMDEKEAASYFTQTYTP
jgi:hypothetical protein